MSPVLKERRRAALRRGSSPPSPAGAHATSSSSNSCSLPLGFLFPPPFFLFYLSAFRLHSQFLPLLLISPVFPLNRHLTLFLRTPPKLSHSPSCYTEQHVATGWVPARSARPAVAGAAPLAPSPPRSPEGRWRRTGEVVSPLSSALDLRLRWGGGGGGLSHGRPSLSHPAHRSGRARPGVPRF